MARSFGDESFHEHPEYGFYVLAGVVFVPAAIAGARQALQQMRGARRTGKLHWNEMDVRQQCSAAKQLADFDGLHVVVVGSPVPQRRQERARAQCLRRLVTELHSYEVTSLHLEARTQTLDKRDVQTVAGARQQVMPKGVDFRVDHPDGASEPLLWAADIVAGACRSAREGNTRPRELLAGRIYEISIDTQC